MGRQPRNTGGVIPGSLPPRRSRRGTAGTHGRGPGAGTGALGRGARSSGAQSTGRPEPRPGEGIHPETQNGPSPRASAVLGAEHGLPRPRRKPRAQDPEGSPRVRLEPERPASL
ncbi:hypothetical protein NDU88_004284 [Pleurodeles waltl]|uniref:Uncharacterized protein n=1 Tax=Pleurodeles waltl TaxID=8319 RepID=A0AAV7QC57_PLEWA|nr:hypothetical protein NDU88_004284 [Pleurodeles waltl]